MSLYRSFLNLVAAPLKLRRRHQPRYHATDPRILVIRRNRMGDMIYTLPLLHALRRHFPEAHITVACDPRGRAHRPRLRRGQRSHRARSGLESLAGRFQKCLASSGLRLGHRRERRIRPASRRADPADQRRRPDRL